IEPMDGHARRRLLDDGPEIRILPAIVRQQARVEIQESQARGCDRFLGQQMGPPRAYPELELVARKYRSQAIVVAFADDMRVLRRHSQRLADLAVQAILIGGVQEQACRPFAGSPKKRRDLEADLSSRQQSEVHVSALSARSCGSGMSVAKRPFHLAMPRICAVISARMFHGNTTTTSGFRSKISSGANTGTRTPGMKRPCLWGLRSTVYSMISVPIPQ